MQQINLSQPCDVPMEQMTATANGWHCAHCAKEVIDYSGMTDAQMLAHIQKHGLGCGSFLDTQLNRQLAPVKKRVNPFNYAYALLLTFLMNDEPAQAQARQATEQTPARAGVAQEHEAIDTIIKTENYVITKRRFGGAAMICSSVEKKKKLKYYRIPFTKVFFAPKKLKFTRN
jgi:hypothetical protein